MMTFAEKVKHARTEQGLKQTELAEKIGVTKRTITAYESGEKKPRTITLLKLAEALQVSAKFLSDDECEDPLEDIERDSFIKDAHERYGSKGDKDIKKLLDENTALFAGGDYSEEQKEAFFLAVMRAYMDSKEAAKQKYGRKI